ncbi:MAG: hypothetical protein LBK94_12165 [Prevotellaceae bacterium]|jgi:hypothetical protein|nr:hypothetical protein [Prevotellaceae bacterium]
MIKSVSLRGAKLKNEERIVITWLVMNKEKYSVRNCSSVENNIDTQVRGLPTMT